VGHASGPDLMDSSLIRARQRLQMKRRRTFVIWVDLTEVHHFIIRHPFFGQYLLSEGNLLIHCGDDSGSLLRAESEHFKAHASALDRVTYEALTWAKR
jgi:hypothetical protein